MITLKNGCKARNLQEQVAYNTSEITKLKYLVGGAYIEIDDTALTHTGTLTSDMKAVLDAYEVVYVFLKQDDDLYQVFRTDYYEDKFRKSAIIVGSSLHKLDLDYDNSTWSYSEETIVGTTDAAEIGKVVSNVKMDSSGKITTEKELISNVLRAAQISDKNQAVAFHNAIPGGRDISAYLSDGADWADGKAQFWKRLQGGTFAKTDGTNVTFTLFEGLFVGDYWAMTEKIRSRQDDQTAQTNAGTEYVMIAGFDTMWGNGEDAYKVNYHHVVMVPGKPDGSTMNAFGQHRMNATDTTTGGYKSSVMNSTVIGSATSTAKRFSADATATINEQLYAEFGSHLATTHELLSNAIDSSLINRFGSAGGATSGWEWVACQAVLMSEHEIYGGIAWSSSGHDIGNVKVQLPLFRLFPIAINNRISWYWLKDVASSTYFCSCGSDGAASHGSASGARDFVRPRFVLKA